MGKVLGMKKFENQKSNLKDTEKKSNLISWN